jgi:hypothetical protein
MDNLLLYLAKVSFWTGIFYLCYILFFSTDTFYLRNRIYLLISLILSFIIPLVKISGFSTGVVPIEPMKRMNDIILSSSRGESTIAEKVSSINLNNLFTWFYFAVAGLLLLRVLISVTKAYSIIRKGTLKDTVFPKIILSEMGYPPFSFFPFVVIPGNKYNSADYGEILRHESAHVRQGHTFDLLLSEVLIAFLWLNPFIWLFRRSIVLNHEYLADNIALKNSGNIKEYQYKLLNISKDLILVPLAHNYSNSVKKRIVMINKRPTHYYVTLKNIIIIPIVATLMVMCSYNNDELIPGYYSGTSGDETFIPIQDCRDSDAPKTDLAKLKDKDLVINRIKYNGNADMYAFTTIHKINNKLEEHIYFAAVTIYDYDKSSYKWENDTTLKLVMINSSNMSTVSYRIIYDKNKNEASMANIGIHFENPEDGLREANLGTHLENTK